MKENVVLAEIVVETKSVTLILLDVVMVLQV